MRMAGQCAARRLVARISRSITRCIIDVPERPRILTEPDVRKRCNMLIAIYQGAFHSTDPAIVGPPLKISYQPFSLATGGSWRKICCYAGRDLLLMLKLDCKRCCWDTAWS